MKQQDKKDYWEIPSFLVTNWKIVSYDLIKIVFDQSEKYLAETVKIGEGITEKAMKILGIAIALLTVSLGYLLSGENVIKVMALASAITALLSFLSILFLIKPIWWYVVQVPGSPPDKIFVDERIITKFKSADSQAKNFLLSECQSYQKRINHNKRVNLKRNRYVTISMVLLIATPISILISFLYYS